MRSNASALRNDLAKKKDKTDFGQTFAQYVKKIQMKQTDNFPMPSAPQTSAEATVSSGIPRRSFLKSASLTAAGIAVLAACKKDDTPQDQPTGPVLGANGYSFGIGDVAILNFAYALEQLEAAFYSKVVSSFYAGASDDEKLYLTDISNHELAHREFFKAALGGNALPALQVDFTGIDFTSRASVLGAARTFEDLGVQAYNGAGVYIKDAGYLTLAGKIVSVEARHAAYIRDLLNPNSFADQSILNTDSLDQSKKPQVVLAAAKSFIKTALDASTLPNN